MKYAPLGVSYQRKQVLSNPIDEADIAKNIAIHEKDKNAQGKGAHYVMSETKIAEDRIKWSYVIHEDDPHREEFVKIIEPLAKKYEMQTPSTPLPFYGDQTISNYKQWINKHYDKVNYILRPNHILLIGDPKLIPFEFQSLLDIKANVGRVCFDTIEEMQNYVTKVINLKNNPPNLRKETLFFAPDWGYTNGTYDATHYSHNDMVIPLSNTLRNEQIGAKIITEKQATKDTLKSELEKSQSALVYVASHGVGDIEGLENQRALTGAICGQNWNQDNSDLFTAKDIPDDDTPFLEGSMFVQFSCFGYGTHKYDDITDLSLSNIAQRKIIADEALVAAIPKKLLAHPRGPVAFIGHVNTTYLQGFYDDNMVLSDEDKRDLSPFESMLSKAFHNETMGSTLHDMNMKAASDAITFADRINTYDPISADLETDKAIAREFLSIHDSKNFLLFGDPGVRLSNMNLK